MPSRDEIFREINSIQPVDSVRRSYLQKLASITGHDILLYSSAWTSFQHAGRPSYHTMMTNQDMPGFMSALQGLKNRELDMVIHSPGGDANATDQLVNYLRSKYDRIRVIIPQNAMSAATMLACAADEIVMGKHSALGPIDPQIMIKEFSVPAQAILDEFSEAKKSISKEPGTAPLWLKKMDQYPHGIFKICEDQIDLAKTRVSTWLATWMLKNDPDKDNKAKLIAKWLGESKNHKTHGKPIGISDAINHGLIITPLESDQRLQEAVLSLYHSTCATHEMTGCVKIIENQYGKGIFVNLQSPPR